MKAKQTNKNKLKKFVQMLYKYKTSNKQLWTITNKLNISLKLECKLNIIKLLIIYLNYNIKQIKKQNLALIIAKQQIAFLQTNNFAKISKNY